MNEGLGSDVAFSDGAEGADGPPRRVRLGPRMIIIAWYAAMAAVSVTVAVWFIMLSLGPELFDATADAGFPVTFVVAFGAI